MGEWNRAIGRGVGVLVAACAFAFPAGAQAAHDVTISAGATAGVTFDGATHTFVPTTDDAVLNVGDLQDQLANTDVAVSSGATGSQSGVINIDSSIASSATHTLQFAPAAGISLDAPTVQSGGDQTYGGPLTLHQDAALTVSGAHTLTFAGSVNGPFALTVATGTFGTETFSGAVGASSALTSLTAMAPGSTAINGGSVVTTGAQSYNGPVTIGSNATLSSTNAGAITFSATLNGPSALQVLTAGTTTFGGAVGPTFPFARLSTGDAGSTVLGRPITTVGRVDFNNPVTLAADTSIFTMQLGNVTFGSTVDGHHALTVTTGGIASYQGAVGGVTPLSTFSSNSSNPSGSGQLAGGGVTTTGAQTYAVPFTLAADTALTSTAGGDIDLNAVDGDHGLTINTSGLTTLEGDIGDLSGPTDLTIGPGGSTSIRTLSITTRNAQAYENPMTVRGDATLTSYNSSVSASAPIDLGTHLMTVGAQSGGTLSAPVTNGALEFDGADSNPSSTLTLAATNDAGFIAAGGYLSFSALANLGFGVLVAGGGLHWAPGNTADISSLLEFAGGGGTLDTGGNDVTLAGRLFSVTDGPFNVSKTGSGTLTLLADDSDLGPQNVIVDAGTLNLGGVLPVRLNVQSGATANVAGTVTGAVVNAGTLHCQNGTLKGGVDNNNGTVTGAPDAPTITTTSPGDRSVSVGFTLGAAHCFPVSYKASAAPAGAQASGLASPLSVNGLTNGTPYTFTVTATNPVGSAASAPSSPATPQGPATPRAPAAHIAAPANGHVYELGQNVPTHFSCSEGTGGPGLRSCTDSNGSSTGAGHIDTSHKGRFTYRVTATSADGQTTVATITLTVVSPDNRFSVTHLPIRRDGRLTLALTLPRTGELAVVENARQLTFATARLAVRAGRVVLTTRPGPRGRRLLRSRAKGVVLRVAVT